MSDFGDISRLQEEQQKTLKNCELMIEKWEKFQEDYTALHGLLDNLPKKTTHEIMVPVGPLAFMPGQLIHTNEIMVLLGDNWFAERSASQAVEIAQRRLKNVEEYLSNLHQEQENVLSHMAFTSDIANVKSGQSDFKEIKEELSEKDRQRSGQKTHRVAHSRASKDSVKRVNLKTVLDTNSCSASSSDVKDKDLFARLDELETREIMNNELDDRTVNTFEGGSCGVNKKGGNEDALTKKTSKKRVKWKKGFVDENGKETVAFPKDEMGTITFAHSKEKATSKENQSIASPADIFHDYLRKRAPAAQILQQETQRPRPILKNSNESEPKDKIFTKRELPQSSKSAGDDSLARGQDKSGGKVQAKVVSAFADLVVEHKDNQDSDDCTRKEEKQETRKISKFKAARMKNK